jgi:hypothetical protein
LRSGDLSLLSTSSMKGWLILNNFSRKIYNVIKLFQESITQRILGNTFLSKETSCLFWVTCCSFTPSILLQVIYWHTIQRKADQMPYPCHCRVFFLFILTHQQMWLAECQWGGEAWWGDGISFPVVRTAYNLRDLTLIPHSIIYSLSKHMSSTWYLWQAAQAIVHMVVNQWLHSLSFRA